MGLIVLNLRLISFRLGLLSGEVDSFESEVGGGLVSTLWFGSEICVWFLRKYKKIWVLSSEFGGRKFGFDFCV